MREQHERNLNWLRQLMAEEAKQRERVLRAERIGHVIGLVIAKIIGLTFRGIKSLLPVWIVTALLWWLLYGFSS